MKNPAEKCPKFENCGASLCPLDKKHLEIGAWYPDEEICKWAPVPDWVLTQRKIAKKAKDNNKYFTYGMLKRNCKIVKGITGLDPDKAESPQLEKWFQMHPPKKELSKLQKKIIARRFKKAREKNKKED